MLHPFQGARVEVESDKVLQGDFLALAAENDKLVASHHGDGGAGALCRRAERGSILINLFFLFLGLRLNRGLSHGHGFWERFVDDVTLLIENWIAICVELRLRLQGGCRFGSCLLALS